MANWFPINMSRLFIWEKIAFFSMNAPGTMGYLWVQCELSCLYIILTEKKQNKYYP